MWVWLKVVEVGLVADMDLGYNYLISEAVE